MCTAVGQERSYIHLKRELQLLWGFCTVNKKSLRTVSNGIKLLGHGRILKADWIQNDTRGWGSDIKDFQERSNLM